MAISGRSRVRKLPLFLEHKARHVLSCPRVGSRLDCEGALVQASSRPGLLKVVSAHALLGFLLEGHVGHHDHHLDAQLGLVAGEVDGLARSDRGVGLLVDGAAAVAVMKPAARALDHEAGHAVDQRDLAASLGVRLGLVAIVWAASGWSDRPPLGLARWIRPGGLTINGTENRVKG